MSDTKASEFFAYDFSQENPGARKRVYERFMAAQQDEDLFVLLPSDESEDLSDQALEMLAAAGNVHLNGFNGLGDHKNLRG
ncbi:MAG: hypothetical protein Q4A01_09475 [Coriobacteriales bacterium]|nr:hypothetical protein [Coriobacteriales bacterium]